MSNDELIIELRKAVGRQYVLTSARRTKRFRKGFRSGEGDALAVVQPANLLELWRILQACVVANKVIIMQAANTGLTEGSTPKGRYDREVVIINTRRMDQIQLLDGGKQVLAFSGATLFGLTKSLTPLRREAHSVIGSSCIGASVVGGVCNNSGGSLVERGPSYTELSLYAQITSEGKLELVNNLGLNLGQKPEDILTRLQRGDYLNHDVIHDDRKASDTEYAQRVRNVDADTPARFNADKSRLYEAAGCAGKLAVFAVRLDTYPMSDRELTYYIGTNSTRSLSELRREVLSTFDILPVSAEYLHEDVFDLSDRYGKDTMIMIDKLGTDLLPRFFALKGVIDSWLAQLPFLANVTDHVMQLFARLWPNILPKRLRDYRKSYEHHLILKMRDGGIDEAQHLLKRMQSDGTLNFFECSDREAKMASLLRFAAAGAAVRYMAIHAREVEGIIPLDIALRRNDPEWFETLPDEISEQLIGKIYYGHFMCHVLHQDYIVKKGADPKVLKKAILDVLDQRGVEYPAEHNVGHLYTAKPDLAEFYQSLDPTNSMNPGIGRTSRKKDYT